MNEYEKESKSEYSESHREERYSDGTDLIDSNEQEQKKIGWRRSDQRRKKRLTEKISSRAETKEVPVSRELVKMEREEEEAPKDLLADSVEKEPLPKPMDEEIPSAFDWNRGEGDQKNAEATEKRRKAPHGSAVLCAVILISTVVLAMGVLAVALAMGRNSQEDASAESDLSVEEAPVPSSENEKVIFVKQYHDDSGVLSTPELYARYADTVVSILGKNAKATGVGSGFILTKDGYIATANHVVEGMDELTVVLADGTAYAATTVAGDSLTDLALLKIDGQDLPTVTLGSSTDLLTGERVIAIGTPASLDYAGSVCSGEISYLARTVKIYDESTGALQKKMTLIQTNAPVNPGNSGCPLFNEYGEVIGVITMKLGSDYSGIGFAIPADGAMPILRAMMAGEELTDSLLAGVGVPAPRLGIVGENGDEGGILGVRILRFSPEYGPASSILSVGDLIVQVDGIPVAHTGDVSEAILSKSPGDTVTVTVLRSGQRLTFEVTLGK